MSAISNWLQQCFVYDPHGTQQLTQVLGGRSSLVQNAKIFQFFVPLASGTGKATLYVCPESQHKASDVTTLIILVHDLKRDGVSYLQPWIEGLLSDGVAVLCPEWDGHGESCMSQLDFQQATRSLSLIMQRLAQNNKAHANVVLMGFGVGGLLCLHVASCFQTDGFLKGVIAITPTMSLRYMNRWFMVFCELFYYRKNIYLKISLPLFAQLQLFINEFFKVRPLIAHMTVPLLWVHGKYDRFNHFDDARSMVQNMRTAQFFYCDFFRGFFGMRYSKKLGLACKNFVSKICALVVIIFAAHSLCYNGVAKAAESDGVQEDTFSKVGEQPDFNKKYHPGELTSNGFIEVNPLVLVRRGLGLEFEHRYSQNSSLGLDVRYESLNNSQGAWEGKYSFLGIAPKLRMYGLETLSGAFVGLKMFVGQSKIFIGDTEKAVFQATPAVHVGYRFVALTGLSVAMYLGAGWSLSSLEVADSGSTDQDWQTLRHDLNSKAKEVKLDIGLTIGAAL